MCVGRPVGGADVSIIRIDDGVIPDWSDDLRVPQGEIGEIVVRGPTVTKSYYGLPDATALAKINGSLHRMGDVGYLDDRGRIWFCGRKSHRVTFGDQTLFTIPCEGIFNVHKDVYRSALVAGATGPVLCVELEPGAREREKEIRRELLEIAAANPLTSSIRQILFHPAFPVDIRHNSKIFREKLARWAAQGETESPS